MYTLTRVITFESQDDAYGFVKMLEDLSQGRDPSRSGTSHAAAKIGLVRHSDRRLAWQPTQSGVTLQAVVDWLLEAMPILQPAPGHESRARVMAGAVARICSIAKAELRGSMYCTDKAKRFASLAEEANILVRYSGDNSQAEYRYGGKSHRLAVTGKCTNLVWRLHLCSLKLSTGGWSDSALHVDKRAELLDLISELNEQTTLGELPTLALEDLLVLR